MLDPDRKQNASYGRATHQLREIEYNCREVASMSKYLNTLASEVAGSEVNCRKVEIFKTEIKDKLKEFALSIDEIYQVLDRKIIVILAELRKMESRDEKPPAPSTCGKCTGRTPPRGQEENEKMVSSESDRMFSDTLNPRITHLEARINQYHKNEERLKGKVAELKKKNEALLEEFNRLSTASNRKINELASRISSKDSFTSDQELFENSPKKPSSTPYLASPAKPKKTSPLYYETDQFSYQHSHEGSFSSDPFNQEEKPHLLNFGCMPARVPKLPNSPLGVSDVSEKCQRLERDDRNRRFDLLLNKLRNSQQESTDESHSQELRQASEQPGSVFSNNIVQRYQV